VRVGASLIGAAIIAVSIYVSYRSASRLISAMGETGTNVFLRLSAFILLCVGVAILWSGVVGLVQNTEWYASSGAESRLPGDDPRETTLVTSRRAFRSSRRRPHLS